MRTKILILTLFLAAGTARAQSWSDLPDWSGDWVVEQPAKADPPPSYKPGWSAKPAAEDPFRTCGLPAGAPRMMGLPGVHEFVVRPGEVWHAVETGNTVQRIYTDGRGHPDGDTLFATYTGDNVGHWEGQGAGRTLVIDTVGLRDDTWLDAKGHAHSDQTHVTTRLSKVGAELVAKITIEDPVAFTRPWTLTRHYRRLPAGSFVHDWACRIVKSPAEVN